MRPAPLDAVRWLIQPAGEVLPEPVYLHVFDDGEAEVEMDFLPDRTRALRFVSATAAQLFALAHRLAGVAVTDHLASDLLGAPTHPFDRVAAVA